MVKSESIENTARIGWCVSLKKTQVARLLAYSASILAFGSARELLLDCTLQVPGTKLKEAKSPSAQEPPPTTQNPGCREYLAASARIRIEVRVLSDTLRSGTASRCGVRLQSNGRSPNSIPCSD